MLVGRTRLPLSLATRLAVMVTSAPVVAGPSVVRWSSYRPGSPETKTVFQEKCGKEPTVTLWAGFCYSIL